MNFSFPYTHENPFPVSKFIDTNEVDIYFNDEPSEICQFLHLYFLLLYLYEIHFNRESLLFQNNGASDPFFELYLHALTIFQQLTRYFHLKTMDTLLIILAGIFLITGLTGCVVSKLPGTPLCYLGIVLLQYSNIAEFSVHFFIKWGVLIIAVQGLDYFIPDWGNRKFGGSKNGVWGSMVGMFAGMYLGPWGIITGAITGAFIGELFAGKVSNDAIHHAIGSFTFFILGTISQLIVSGILIYYYLENLSYVI